MHDSADTSDFLARERALLGDDADQFSTPQDNIPGVSVEDGDDDLLGGGDGQTNDTSDGMMQFQSSFPSIDTRNEVWQLAKVDPCVSDNLMICFYL